jgi:asparagine synthase (glutamine-hydrolysing)
MAGLAGFIDRNQRLADAPGTLRAMATAVAHRGAGAVRALEQPRLGLAMAHVGARGDGGATLALSPDGHWAVAADADLCPRPAHEAANGASSDADGAARIAAAIEAHGVVEALPHLDGPWAFAALNLQTHTLWLARDRWGSRPLLHGRAEDGRGPGVFVFASELGAFRACPLFGNKVSALAAADVLERGSVPAPRTMFVGVHALPPGHVLSLDVGTGRVEEHAWHSQADVRRFSRASPFAGTRDEAVRELDALLGAEAARRLPGRGEVCVLLDGTAAAECVLATVRRECTAGLHALVPEWMPAQARERALAVAQRHDAAVRTCRWPVESPVAAVEEAIGGMDQPVAHPAALTAALAMHEARRHAGTLATGASGDAFWGGGSRARLARVVFAAHHLPGMARRAAARALEAGLPDLMHGALRRMAHSLPQALRAEPLERLAEAGAEVLRATTLAEAWRVAQSAWSEPADLLDQLAHDAWRSAIVRQLRGSNLDGAGDAGAFLDAVLQREQQSRLADTLLTVLDRAANERQVRLVLPFLDDRLAELSWRVPAEWRAAGVLEAVTHSDASLLEEVAGRHAAQAAHADDRADALTEPPLAEWLSGPLHDWVEALLAESAMGTQGIADPTHVRAAWARCKEGSPRAARQVWAACVLCRWCQRAGIAGDRIARA